MSQSASHTPQDLSPTPPGPVPHTPRTCPLHPQDLFPTPPGPAPYTPRTCPPHPQDLFPTPQDLSPTHPRDLLLPPLLIRQKPSLHSSHGLLQVWTITAPNPHKPLWILLLTGWAYSDEFTVTFLFTENILPCSLLGTLERHVAWEACVGDDSTGHLKCLPGRHSRLGLPPPNTPLPESRGIPKKGILRLQL